MKLGKAPAVFPSHFLPMILLFVLLVGVNVFLVSPYIAWYDSGELIGNTICLGISHPDGQALFHLLGKCFLLWPWGKPAFRVELTSVFCAAFASVLFFDLCRRLVTALMPPDLLRRDLSGPMKIWLFLLTLGWGWSLPWWRYSLTPLVYALHLLMAMLILWALSLEKPWRWQLAFFLLGAATVLRPTQYFVLPFMVIVLMVTRWRLGFLGNLKFAVQLIVFFLLGWSVALYLPLRSALHPEMAYGDLTHLNAAFHHLFALRFSKYVGTIGGSNVLSILRQMAVHYFQDLTPLGMGLAVWGFGFLWWEKDRVPVFLWVGLGWGLAEAAFVLTIPYPTFESHQVILSWAFSGFLAAMPLTLADQVIRKGQYKGVMRLIYLVMVVFVLAQLSMMPHLLDRKMDRTAQDYARNVLSLMAPNALYLPYEENEYFPLAGYQESFSFRKDIELLEPGQPPEVMGKKVDECLREGRPIYVTHHWTMSKYWTYEPIGPIWRIVLSHPLTGQKLTSRETVASWGGVKLLSVSVEPSRVEAGGMVWLTYHWERTAPSPEDGTQSVVALFTDEKGSYPTREGSFWLHDVHEPFGLTFGVLKTGLDYTERRLVMIPSDYPVGTYRLSIGLQKKVDKQSGEEDFHQEFYERNASQSLDKFEARGEGNVLVRFATDNSAAPDSLWPVSQSQVPPIDSRFVPTASLDIVPPSQP